MQPHHGTTVSSSLTSAWDTTSPAYSGSSIHAHNRISVHRTFYWGHTTEILFSGWPGSNTHMYALALVFVFVMAVLTEFFNLLSSFKPPGSNKLAAGFFQTGMYVLRAGLSYLVMLSVMSFNGGVFLVAVGGHAVGFVIFGRGGIFKKFGGSDLPSRKG